MMMTSKAMVMAMLRGGAALSAIALGASPALAQQSTAAADSASAGAAGTGQQSSDIVVTGFRGSILKSLNDKRDSDVQIDEINAQDIADFPDSNLAESLQRLP